MKKVPILIISCYTLLIALWMSMLITNAHTDTVVGVKVGDYVEYTVNIAGIPELAELDWIKAEVKEIVGIQVTEHITFHYKNGTNTSETRTVDISTEADFVTSSYLNVGDSRTVPSPGGTITVSKILNRNYFGISREVVLFNQTETGRAFQAYYDRKTGFLLEMHYWLSEFGVEVHLSYSLHTTNLWTQQQYPSLTIIKWIQEYYIYIILLIIAGLTLYFILFKTRRRRKPEQI